jgi:Na+-translocating ferredoxin:NAD+ oxidoreductase RnfA subunit
MKNVKNKHGNVSLIGRVRVMSKDQGWGLAIFVLSVVGIILYAWFVYGWPLITLQVTAFLAVALILVIAAWIGYTMATTPPPAPLEPEPLSTSSAPANTTDDKTNAKAA